MTKFVQDTELLDQNVGLATFDRVFIATNVNPNKPQNKEDQVSTQELERFEFWELLVRLATAKYKDTGIC